jgi:hypothetical protein
MSNVNKISRTTAHINTVPSVLLKICFLSASLLLLLAMISTVSLAQEMALPAEIVTLRTLNEEPIGANLASGQGVQEAKPNSQLRSNTDKQRTILRLEDTIRGNKDQPQVLTIVPWQLPVHQRINENKEWQLQVKQLPSIERNAFLRSLAVVKEIEVGSASTSELQVAK